MSRLKAMLKPQTVAASSPKIARKGSMDSSTPPRVMPSALSPRASSAMPALAAIMPPTSTSTVETAAKTFTTKSRIGLGTRRKASRTALATRTIALATGSSACPMTISTFSLSALKRLCWKVSVSAIFSKAARVAPERAPIWPRISLYLAELFAVSAMTELSASTEPKSLDRLSALKRADEVIIRRNPVRPCARRVAASNLMPSRPASFVASAVGLMMLASAAFMPVTASAVLSPWVVIAATEASRSENETPSDDAVGATRPMVAASSAAVVLPARMATKKASETSRACAPLVA